MKKSDLGKLKTNFMLFLHAMTLLVEKQTAVVETTTKTIA